MRHERARKSSQVRVIATAIAAWAWIGLAWGLVAGSVCVIGNDSLRTPRNVTVFLVLLCGLYSPAFGLAGLAIEASRRVGNRLAMAFGRASPAEAVGGGAALFAGHLASAGCVSILVAIGIGLSGDRVEGPWGVVLQVAILLVAAAVAWSLPPLLVRRLARPAARRVVWIAGGLLCAVPLAVALATAIHRSAPASPAASIQRSDDDAKVILIGLDGADWRKIDDLIAAGRLPSFDALVRRGARAYLQTQRPTLSPILWTSMATGMSEEKHGIHGFTETALPGLTCGVQRLHPKELPPFPGLRTLASLLDRQELLVRFPVTSCQRRVKSLWNVLSDQGVRVGVVSWFATWPSEPVDGYLVSDNNPWRAAFLERRFDRTNPVTAGITYPPDLIRELVDVPVPKVSADAGEILALSFFGELGQKGLERLRPRGDLLEVFRTIYLSDSFTASAGLELLKRGDLRFLAIYVSGIDNVSHRFSRFPGVVDRYYEFVDGLLARYLERMDEHTTLVIVSDHGFAYGRLRVWGHDHAPDGILLLAGRSVRAGARLEDAAIVDVAPTILGLMGMPTTREMEGQLIREALTEGALVSVPSGTIESYGGHRAPVLPSRDTPQAAALTDETLRRLRVLGYIE